MLRPIDSWPVLGRAAVGGLHDRRTAARADDEMLLAFLVAAALARQPRQLARDVVIMRLGLEPLGDLLLLLGLVAAAISASAISGDGIRADP